MIQRRKFGRHDLTVSALGFGMMRLPVLDNDNARVDEAKTAEMVHYAVEQGVNYIDTGYNYHREQSEIAVGKVLKQGLRDKVNLATKCPVWMVKSHEDFDPLLNRQLEKLQTDHIDMYLLHGLSKDRWPTLVQAEAFKFLQRAKADGRIRFAGFSFHDDVGTFKTIVDAHDWDFCQIQYNYMDVGFQAGTEGLKYASSKGMAVVVMEPLRGGSLVKNVPAEVGAIWDRSAVKRTPAEWGLRWVWNHPEVSLLLSGMGAMEQVKENLRTAETALPNSLTADELALYEEVRQCYRSRTKVNCTKCQYCQPCPQGIVIPEWFGAYNSAFMFNNMNRMANFYERSKAQWGDPGACVECGNCEEKCPQRLPVRQLLRELRTDATPKH